MSKTHSKSFVLGEFTLNIDYFYCYSINRVTNCHEEGVKFIITCPSFSGVVLEYLYSLDEFISSSFSIHTISTAALDHFQLLACKDDASRE